MIKITENRGHTDIEVKGDMPTLIAEAACIVKALYSELHEGNNTYRHLLLSNLIVALGTAVDEDLFGRKKDE